MKNVYFVQVDITADAGSRNVYLPYTAGLLAANAWTSEAVRTRFLLKDFLFLRDKIGDVLSSLEAPAVMLFCCYCWNTEYNKALAKAVKAAYPDCVIVFGGHNVPDDTSFLEAFPYIDILSHGEGEATVKALLEALALGAPLASVFNVSFRTQSGECVHTPAAQACGTDYPSPYLEGLFDGILRRYPGISFNATLETTRGCPYHCAYCDWGPLESRVRMFPMERVKAEILWMSEHKIAFLWEVDANFGLFERDAEIADFLVETRKRTGYPERMRVNYAKNNPQTVFEITQKFRDCNFDRGGATLSFQSMSPEVLRNIGRTNRDIAFYKALLTEYNRENIRTYSELILGLPGETYESFIRGVGMLFEIGQHFVYHVFSCILLPNSLMGQKAYIEKYGIRTVRARIESAHARNDPDEIPEYNEVIVETGTLSRAEWVRAKAFNLLATVMHASGLLRVFAVYAYVENRLPYERFYNDMLSYMEAGAGLRFPSLFMRLAARFEALSRAMPVPNLTFAPCGDVVWEDHEYFVLCALAEDDLFYRELTPFLRRFVPDETLFADLLAYQRAVLRRPQSAECRLHLQYDVHGFISDAYVSDFHPVRSRRSLLVLRDSAPMPDWPSFGKQVIWYGRMGWASYKDDISQLPADAPVL